MVSRSAIAPLPQTCDRPFSNPSFVIPADLEPMQEHFLHLKAIDLVAFLEVRSPLSPKRAIAPHGRREVYHISEIQKNCPYLY
jgi:hypothetical protein